MRAFTFAEKILGAPAGSIVFREPDILLTHDNTSSIHETFRKMGGERIRYPERMMVVLDHNAPPADSVMATRYQEIRDIVKKYDIGIFYDSGMGICHQLMSYHARPGMIITGSDSHTSTAGAFNAFAAGIDRTESAAIWKTGETWFRVPESMKIILTGKLKEGVSAKDLALWIIGMTGSDGANYMSVEFHGDGIGNLSISDRMVLANMASEMGAKNAVFPADDVLPGYPGNTDGAIWADEGAHYSISVELDMESVFPVVAAPHNVDNIISVADAGNITVHEGLIGTCTNGRIEDLRIAASLLKGRKVKEGFQLHIVPASREILLRAIDEGIISDLVKAGANILSPSCGPCLGTGQGIPADNHNVVSTANRNFRGRMGNRNASIYLASPATVACSALTGRISDPRVETGREKYPFSIRKETASLPEKGEARKRGKVWDYSDFNNINTDLMFPGKHTYSVQSSEPAAILPFLFEDFDPLFHTSVAPGDLIVAGENFGCGSSREHPSAGLAYAGIKAVIVKSANRIFYRSSINQGLLLIVCREAVEAYRPGDEVELDTDRGVIFIGGRSFAFTAPAGKLGKIIEMKGLVNFIKTL